MSGIVFGAVVAAGWQAIGHWFKWEVWTGQRMGRLAAYTWGVLGMLAGMLVWAWLSADALVGSWTALMAALVMAIASGASTVMAYGMDWLGHRVHYARTRERMDTAVGGEK